MKTIIDYLDDLKAKTGSDNKTATALNISRISVNQIRKRGSMADETALKLADALGIDRDELLIVAAIARSEGEAKNAWIAHAKKFGIAATLAIIAALPAKEVTNGQVYREPSLYIMLNWLTGTLIAFFRLFSTRSQKRDTQKTRTKSQEHFLPYSMA